MYKVYLAYNDGLPYIESFDPALFEATEDHEEADVICLPGGHDVHPALYGEKVNGAYCLEPVDDLEAIYLLNRYIGVKPIVGICRGFQLLAALRGFRINQDNPAHMDLVAHILTNGEAVTSAHHQTVHYDSSKWLADANIKIKSYAHPDGLDPVVEAFYAPDEGMLGVQWHPYAEPKNSWGYLYFNKIVKELVEQFLCMKTN